MPVTKFTLTAPEIGYEKTITLNIEETPACMNIGVAFMPFMRDGYYFLKEDNINSLAGFNEVEKNFVKYLYKIRKCNKTKEKLEYTFFAGPNASVARHRVFIAGKIFPIMNIYYGNKFKNIFSDDADCTNIKIKYISPYELRLLFNETLGEDKNYNTQYISIDNDKIRIFLPKYTEIGIDYAGLLYDFLTNGKQTEAVVNYGEFPDLETYTLATSNVILKDGCWLKVDREKQTQTWKNACFYIIENKLQGILAPFAQIYNFYDFVDAQMSKFNHKSRWCIGAKKLVGSLAKWIEKYKMSTLIDNDLETILNELNIGICDYAITQFYELFYGKYKDAPLDTLEKAYQFDLKFVTHEQGVVAVPIYKKTDKNTIQTYQAMADKDGVTGYPAGLFNDVIPEFDEPWQGKVTDANFRIDLPMLMLWLDRHRPTSEPFKDKVDKDGYLRNEYKKIIRLYETK